MKNYEMSLTDVVKRYKSDKNNGLRQKEAIKRLRKNGENILSRPKKKSFIVKFLSQFTDFMIIILLIAAAISFITEKIEGDSSIDSIIILIIVTINAVIGVAQEDKAERAIDSLKNLQTEYCVVVRDGISQKMKSQYLVAGDLVKLKVGDKIPADLRITKVNNLKTEESSLTGESLPVTKKTEALKKDTLLGDRSNMCYSATWVVSGTGEGIVTETGNKTETGKIAELIRKTSVPVTPLQKRLAVMSKIMGIGAVVLCAIIFILGIMESVPTIEMLLISISLAVAAIPEGLPAVVTIVLSGGVQRLAEKKAIIRHLMAVETLGSASVICSDKTGTLTQNKMSVTKLWDNFGMIDINSFKGKKILNTAALCTNCLENNGHIVGEPVEKAICEACKEKEILDITNKRIKEIPFSSEKKRMTVAVKTEDNMIKIIMKGAPESVQKFCIKRFNAEAERMAKQGLYVIAVAEKIIPYTNNITEQIMESTLNFVGLIGLSDPPRAEVKQSVKNCQNAGIRVVMITGDHAISAKAIAEELNIFHNGDSIITGTELENMNDNDLYIKSKNCSVYARVSPVHKVRIVKALQKNNEVVAMTGDGVNDAPALRKADIGCAMGKCGTDIAKGAADMILADDRFNTIVDAVKEGRGIYQNITKTIHFLLSCNIGELLTVFVGFILRLPLPFGAIQLLWINLVTDSFPALALGAEPCEENIMDKPPIKKNDSILGNGVGISIIIEGCFIGSLAVLAYTIGRSFFDIDADNPLIGRTMSFAVLSLSQLAHSFNMNSEKLNLIKRFKKNKKLILSALVCSVLLCSVIVIPTLNPVFHTVPLNFFEWIITALLSICPIIINKLQLAVTTRKYCSVK